MEQKLLSYGRVRGLVVGAQGEISEDFKSLMEAVGDKKMEELEAKTGGEGKRSVSAQLASYISHNRQQLSLLVSNHNQDLFWTGLRVWGEGRERRPEGEGTPSG